MTEEVQEITAQSNEAPIEPTPQVVEEPANLAPVESTSSSAEFVIPDEYKEKGWSQKIKSPEDLWKQLDSTQSLIGKKSVVPEFKDSQEKMEYLAQFKPADKAEYRNYFPEEGVPDTTKEFFTNAFDEANISSEQAEKVLGKYFEYEKGIQEQAFSQEGFDSIKKTVFPENTEQRFEQVQGFLRENVSDERKEIYNKLPNEVRGLMLELADSLAQKYGVKTDYSPSTQPRENGTVNVVEARKTITQAISDLSKRPHTMEEKQTLIKQLKGTYS
jgi:hypothetical protein